MIHLPPASITSTVRRSSSCTSGGSAPTVLILLPSMTIASLRAAGWPEPSIRAPVREDEEGTRERIMRTAERLFAERGFTGVSVRELAAEAQVNIASIGYHF